MCLSVMAIIRTIGSRQLFSRISTPILQKKSDLYQPLRLEILLYHLLPPVARLDTACIGYTQLWCLHLPPPRVRNINIHSIQKPSTYCFASEALLRDESVNKIILSTTLRHRRNCAKVSSQPDHFLTKIAQLLTPKSRINFYLEELQRLQSIYLHSEG